MNKGVNKMAKDFLDKLSPEDIEDYILPALKNAKKDSCQEENEDVMIPCVVERKFSKRRLVGIFLLVVFAGLSIFSGVKVLAWKADSDNTYEQINLINKNVVIEEVEDTEQTEIINPPEEEDSTNPYWDYIKMNLINVDFSNLLSINKDTKGWLQVNGTNINYPFVQASDNEYYLKRDFNGNKNSAGWVYLDYRNNISNLDQNTIIYAHGRLNGTMFGSLKNIFDSDWFNNSDNHVIKLSTTTENTLWQVFSVYHIPTTSDYLYTNFATKEEFMNFVEMLKNRSQYEFNVEFNENDKILTLSTCYNSEERVVLHAKLIKKEVRR